MKASVIIPTYGSRLAYLRDTLDTLRLQNTDLGDHEVIVVDNGPGADVKKITEEFASFDPRVRYIREASPGLGKARHAGALAALGEILIYLDDDVLLPPNWLGAMLKPYQDERVGCVGGKVVLQMEAKAPDWVEGFCRSSHSALDFGDQTKELHWPDCVWGCNMSVRKKVYEEVGGFNPDFFADPKYLWYTADGECGFEKKIYQAGHKIIYEPQAWVRHRIPASRLTKEFFYQRLFITGIMDSYTAIRAGRRDALLPLRLVSGSFHHFVKGCLKMISAGIKPKWRIKCTADAKHWFAYSQHQLRAAFSPKLRDYIFQEHYW